MENIPLLNKHLIRELDRRQLHNRKKLLTRYNLKEAELSNRLPNYKVPEEIIVARREGHITPAEERLLYNTVFECIHRSNLELELSAKQRRELLHFCKTQIKIFDRLIIEREIIMNEANKLNEPEEETSRLTEPLIDIHQSLAQLKALSVIKSYGFSDADCVSLLGRIIKLAIYAHRDEPYGFVRPGDNYANTEDGRKQFLRAILVMAEKETAGLQDAYRKYPEFRWHGGPPEKG